MAQRHADIFEGNRSYNYAGPSNAIALDQAGVKQFAPDIGNLAGQTLHVRSNTLAFLIEAPRFFQFMPDADRWVRSLKAIIEKLSHTITGLNRTLHVQSEEGAIGGSGEVFQVPTNVTRDRSNPTHVMRELMGRPCTNFIGSWINWGIGDENTKVPLVVSLGNVTATDYDATFYAATVLYIEPDPTMTEVVSAVLCVNMYPTDQPNYEMGKDASQMGVYEDASITFTALSDISLGTKLLARQLLRELNLGGLNPNQTGILFDGVTADVKAASNGLKEQLEQGAADRVTYG